MTNRDRAWLAAIVGLAAAGVYLVPMIDTGHLRDLANLVLGLVLGSLLSLALYWAPLGQLHNELCAFWDLARHRRYFRDQEVTIKQGAWLSSDRPIAPPDFTLRVKYDRGVDWIWTPGDWQRARVVEVWVSPGDGNFIAVHYKSLKR